MAFLIGALLAVIIGAGATFLRVDRDRAFYPTVTIVIASYYALFAVMGATRPVLLTELVIILVFGAAAIAGFRSTLWLVVVALAAHGLLDTVHGRLIANPGVPAWWPMFCIGYDEVAAAYLAWLLLRRTVPARPA